MAKQRPSNRTLEWNVESDPHNVPQTQHVIVLVVSEQREIGRIKEKLIEATRPIGDLTIRAQGIPRIGEGLRYECFTFDTATAPDEIPWPKIYGGKKSRNRDLYERQSQDGLQVYVDKRMS